MCVCLLPAVLAAGLPVLGPSALDASSGVLGKSLHCLPPRFPPLGSGWVVGVRRPCRWCRLAGPARSSRTVGALFGRVSRKLGTVWLPGVCRGVLPLCPGPTHLNYKAHLQTNGKVVLLMTVVSNS